MRTVRITASKSTRSAASSIFRIDVCFGSCLQDIVGARFHCVVCDSVDICSNCESAGLPGNLDSSDGGHDSSHIMIKARTGLFWYLSLQLMLYPRSPILSNNPKCRKLVTGRWRVGTEETRNMWDSTVCITEFTITFDRGLGGVPSTGLCG